LPFNRPVKVVEPVPPFGTVKGLTRFRVFMFAVEEALKNPLTIKLFETVEEALEINPVKEERPATLKVLEALRGLENWVTPTKVVEAADQTLELARLRVAITDPVLGETVKELSVPAVTELTTLAPLPRMQVLPMAKQPVFRLMPFWKVEVAVEEALKPPVRMKLPVTVEEAWEIKPPPRVDKLATLKVDEALNGPLMFKLEEIVEEAMESKPLDNWRTPVSRKRPASVRTPLFKTEKINCPLPVK